MERIVTEHVNYIKSLKIIENAMSNERIPILKSKRKIGFWGLIVAMKSALQLAQYVFEKDLMSYLLTYKLSQDHLETFFSCIRRMGGFNNNPTYRQFKLSYKKLVSHVNSIVPDAANCTLQDNTNVLKINDTSTNTEISNDELVSIVEFEHDYMGSYGWSWSEYSHKIVTYIAGFIVKSIKKSIKCELCLDQLENDFTSSKLITLKNRVTKNKETANSLSEIKGLILPNDDVIIICKTTEKVLRSTPNVFCTKNVLGKLMIHAKKLLLPFNIFSKMDMFLEETIFDNHKLNLINQILNKYFKIRLHHEVKSSQDLVQRVRTFHNRMVLFKNQ